MMFNWMKAVRHFALVVSILIITCSNAIGQADLFTTNNVLAVGNHNDGLSSSDISLILQVEIDGQIVVNEGHAVKYIAPDDATRQTQMPALHEKDFDDSGWEDGISGVGYDDGDDNTEIPSGDVAVIYTRYRFDAPTATSVNSIIIRLDYDDGYVLWLNGTEVGRSANLEAISPVGEIPDWDLTAPRGAMANNGASELAAGTPNPDRVYGEEIEVDVVGQVAAAVEPAGKLATSWASIKANY